MKALLEELFPIYRTLCGPGVFDTLDIIAGELDEFEIINYETGTEVMGWTIPKEFIVNEAWVKNSYGETVIDFREHPYLLWVYSQPFDGEVSLAELKQHLKHQDGCIPLRQTYYKNDWGFCCTSERYDVLPEDTYTVHIDVEHRDGYLRIGECYLEGETEQEILINSYTCHPRGANDNLSGVVCAVDLFKRLSKLENHRYSYRLCLWPETIGPITWIANNQPKRKYIKIKDDGAWGTWGSQILCGMTLGICGDDMPLIFDQSIDENGPLDEPLWHLGVPGRDYSGFMGATDSRHFNGMGLNIPMVTLTRGGPGEFPEYHTSLDTPDIINWDNMEETVDVAFNAIQVLEKNRTYRPTYVTTPCLEKYGIFPYQHDTGTGGNARTTAARAYFELMYLVDGKRDLLSIADSQGMSIFDFDEPVEKFLEAGLIEEVQT